TDRSRTTLGNLLQTLPIGCMRVFITYACSSVVSKLNRLTVPRNPDSSCDVLNCMMWLRARTSSPPRFMSVSSNPTLTRMLLSDRAVARGSYDACGTASADGATTVRDAGAGTATGGGGAGAGWGAGAGAGGGASGGAAADGPLPQRLNRGGWGVAPGAAAA